MTIEEICKKKLIDLGEAMTLLLNGQKISSEQLTMIKESTDKQKVLALELVAANNLKGQEYTNYCHNVIKIGRRKRIIMEKYAKKVVYNFEFSDTSEDSIAENKKLFKLGNAMFKFYQGKELSLEQIELIANSLPAQQINAMNIVAQQLLFDSKKSMYSEYCKNCNMLSDVKKKKKKK